MRPKLKSDTFYLPVDEGVYFRNNEKSFVMKGKKIATWVERLAPLLDGRRDVEQLCQNMPPEKQAMIVKIVQALAEQGYVKDVSLDLPHTLSPELQERYSQAITYINYYTDSGSLRLQKFLDLPVLAIGSGDALVALAHALLETGNRHIHLLDSKDEITDYGRIEENLSILQSECDPNLSLNTIPFTAWDDDAQLQAMLAPFSFVLLFDAGGSLALAHRLNQVCDSMAMPFLSAVVLEDAIHIGPMHQPHTQGCWQCYWRRYQAARGRLADDEYGFPILSTCGRSSDKPGFPAIAVTANLLAFEFFKQGTGVHNATLEHEVFVLELEHLQNVKHRVFPHPLCTVCVPRSLAAASNYEQQGARVCQEVTSLQLRNSVLTRKELFKYVDQWVDETCGIFTNIDEQEYFQLPLMRSKMTIAFPGSPGERLPVVRAAGLDYQETRIRVLREAITFYLDQVVVPQQVFYASYGDVQMCCSIAHPSSFLGWTGASVLDQQEIPWLWGRWLDEEQPVLVPAAAVYPRSFWNLHCGQQLFRRTIPGISVGVDWFETLAQGLLALGTMWDDLEGATVLVNKTFSACRIARDAYSHDKVCATYLKMLEIVGCNIELIGMTSSLNLPRIGAFLDGCFIGVKTHWDALVATREILQEAVLNVQIERSPAPDDSYVQERHAQQARSIHTELVVDAQVAKTLPLSLAAETQHREAAQILQSSLRDNGWEAVIVPAIKDSTIDEVVGCAMHVLLVKRSA